MSGDTVCPLCGRTVPPGAYCGACGAHLAGSSPTPLRRHAFAANPNEHLLYPSVASTLFPHLPPRRSLPFRLALLVIVAALLLLSYLRLAGAAAVVASAVPVLYLLYLYEVEAYEGEPHYVIPMTAGVGAVLGAAFALLTGRYITQTLLLQATPAGAPVGRIVLAAVILPLIAPALMLVGPLIVRFTRPYHEVLDGFVFGAASALGFFFAASLVDLLPEVLSGPVSVLPGVLTAMRDLVRGLLVPLIDAGTTGWIAATIFLAGRPSRRLPGLGWTAQVPAALVGAGIIQVGLGLVDILVIRAATALLIYLGVALLLLFVVRAALHHLLLAEVVDGEAGPEVVCFHCERLVPSMPFCPSCGVARRATPKYGSSEPGRAVR